MLKRFILGSAALALAVSSSFSATATFDASKTHQTIKGFGGGVVYYQNWVVLSPDTAAIYDTAFTGLGLSILRLGNWMQNDSVGSGLSNDVKIVKAAKARLGNRLKIYMSSWSAPDTIKANGYVNGNGASKSKNTLAKTGGAYRYADLAHWWKQTYQAYSDSGITIDYVSMQNEPNWNATYAGTFFDPTENDTVAGYAQALAAFRDSMNTLSSAPQVWGPEVIGIGYNGFQNYVTKFDISDVDAYNYHLYNAGNGNDNSSTNYATPENFRSPMTAIASSYSAKPIIMSEFCTMRDTVQTTDLVGLARIMQIGFTAGDLAAYINWELLWGGKQGQMIGVCPGNGWGSTCTAAEFTVNPEYHAMRHYSKFVGPGWTRIDASTDADSSVLQTVAFTNSAKDSVTQIVINSSTTAAQTLTYSPAGYGLIYAVQSNENGKKSQPLTLSTSVVLPRRSVTTLVFKKGAAAPTTTTSKDETTDSTASSSSSGSSSSASNLEDSYVIADFTTNGLGTWTSDAATAPSLVNATLGEYNTYVKVPFANCDQSESTCGYQNARYTLPDSVVKKDLLKNCTSMTIVMHGIDTGYSNMNVGAVGNAWIDYQYGVGLSLSDGWVSKAVSLAKEDTLTNASAQLKFNSNFSGMYIAKISVSGCATSSIPASTRLVRGTDTHALSSVYTLSGRLVWRGTLDDSVIQGNTLKLNITSGVYLVKTPSKIFSAVKH